MDRRRPRARVAAHGVTDAHDAGHVSAGQRHIVSGRDSHAAIGRAFHAARASGVVGSKSALVRAGSRRSRPRAARWRAGPRTSSRRRPSRSRGRGRGSACAGRPRSRDGCRCTRRSSKCAARSRSVSERNVQRAPVEAFSRKTSCWVLGMIVTSSVNATRAPLVEAQQLAVVLALARAVLAAAEVQHEQVVALQLGQPVHDAVLVGEREVGDGRAGLEVAAHGCPPDAVDAGHGGHVEASGRRRRPRRGCAAPRAARSARASRRRARGPRCRRARRRRGGPRGRP